jgi:glycosyltransferase involved in cell wall biosynthesis
MVLLAEYHATAQELAGSPIQSCAPVWWETMTGGRDAAATAPLVTVLIDTFNYGRFIEQAIESVLSQDFPAERMEVLVVDDGSTDDTSERVRKFGGRISYLHKPNGGQASAFNFGIAKARGEIVALLDADDFWLPGKLRRIAEEFEKHPETGMVYHRLLELNSETNERKEAEFRALSGFLPDRPDELFWFVPYPTSCLAFRREHLRKVLPVPEALRVQADGYISVCIVFLVPILAVPECLAVYRIHGQNLYYDNESAVSPERRRVRISARQVVIDGLQAWLSSNGYDLSRKEVRTFLTRWRLYQDGERFVLDPPGRVRFFSHLFRYSRCYGPQMARRLRIINYFNAFAALVVGYKHYYLVERCGQKISALVRGIVKSPRPA